jgi:tripartite-type tricarboxylate transporter receptor subunit TctC
MLRSFLMMAAALATAAPLAALAQAWPSKPVRIVVPFAAGGPADLYARALAEKLQSALGQPFVVEDKPGGGSIVGTDLVAKSAPDGYTLLMMSNTHTVNESLIPDRPFQLMRDFVPVAPVNYSDLLLVVHPFRCPAKHGEGIHRAREVAARQAELRIVGSGTPYHMAGELFKAMAGIDVVHVPYKGSAGRAHRHPRRPGADDVRRHHDHGAQRAGGKLKALGTSGKDALERAARRADGLRSGVPGYEA